jgi:hypothetical chaperone protein
MRIGLDFGTTNSGAAFFDGRQVHLFALDPAAAFPSVVRSVLYVQRDHRVLIGREAIDTYYQQNSGRPIKIVRQYVGQLEQVYSDGLQVIEDVFARIDELSPGRLLRSLKSELATGYEGTTIFGRVYELEELIAIYLREIRRRVEAETGERVEGVMLGRPVNFVGSDEPAHNARAEERLRRAAERAGFRQVAFELEPVAAALHYELSTAEPQNIIIFDFGGGTLDVTVMRVGQPDDRRLFAVGGVGVAGEVFDRRIIEGLLLDHFGRGSTWGEEAIPFPSQYTDSLLNWQTILDLHRPETLHFLRQVQATGSHPSRVRALEALVVNEEGVRLFDEVERAKIVLSSSRLAQIRLASEEISIWQPLTRSQFEALIAQETARVEECVLDTLARSGLREGEVDAVVRTGGSAQIPGFVDLLGRLFGPEKVVLSDVFSGVTAGLAIRAGMGDHSELL